MTITIFHLGMREETYEKIISVFEDDEDPDIVHFMRDDDITGRVMRKSEVARVEIVFPGQGRV
jgi:hypothetical protein